MPDTPLSIPTRRRPFASSETWLAGILLIALLAGVNASGASKVLVIYALSFWHYYLYWLAYRFGAVPLPVFKRDAVLMKTAALLALGLAYLSAPVDPLSIVVIGAGFVLNSLAARALGSDRTYYGHELAELPPQRISVFPYSWTSHPMLLGNIAAYGGTLMNETFRESWWPLACIHIALNAGLLLMELHVEPQRLHRSTAFARPRRTVAAPAVALTCLAAGAGLGWLMGGGAAAAVGGGAALYAFVMFHWYTLPAAAPHR
jgi:hypothetical protein